MSMHGGVFARSVLSDSFCAAFLLCTSSAASVGYRLMGSGSMALTLLGGALAGAGLVCLIRASLEHVLSADNPRVPALRLGVAVASAVPVALVVAALTSPHDAWVPITVFPLVGLAACLLIPREAQQLSEKRLVGPWLLDMFEKREFLPLSFFAGFMLAYSFNSYPKSFRLAGCEDSALVGLIGQAGLVYLVVALIFVGVLIPVVAKVRSNLLPVMLLAVLTSLAVTYSLLPSMGSSWLPAVALLLVATLFRILVLVGIGLLRLSGRDALSSIAVTCLFGGALAGSAISELYIAMTVSELPLATPVAVHSLLFDWTAAVGLLALVFFAFLMANGALLPSRSIPSEGPGIVAADHALEDRCEALADRCALSDRERQILVLLAQGRSGPFIAEMLQLANGTVKSHIHHIYVKTGVDSRQQLLSLVRGEDA